MHHRENKDHILILGIYNAIWKPPGLTATNIIFKDRSSSGKAEDSLDCRVYFDGEIVTETRLILLVMAYGIEKFRLGFRVEGILHLANRLSALSNT
jgi:hypothetical protein